MAPLASKKRKRDDEGEDGRISFKISALPENLLGPVLVGFPGVQPPANTPFRCYRLKTTEDDPVTKVEKEFAAQPTFVVAETDDVEFFSNSEAVSGTGCTYLVAVHDKRTGKTIFRPAPLHILTRQVKRLKSVQPTPVAVAQRTEARNALGATFGTKKAQAAIRAQERNKIDIDAMKSVTGKLQSTIEGNTTNLPTQEQAKATADDSRLIPPFNADAERPDDVYPITNIITEAEWSSISISAMLKAENDRDRMALLPYNRSAWIKQKVREAFAGRKPSKTTLKLLFAISAMFTFYNARRNVSDKEKLKERLGRIPVILLDGLLTKFTDSARGSTKAHVTQELETNLLTHMFALCLRVDEWATDTTILAGDLSMPVAKVNQLFKSLGCKIEKLTKKELDRRRLPESEVNTKKAHLKVPLEFPKARAKRRN
ncbi:RNA polymerase I associated factor, A49-like protein [Thelephora ganbajun]|uniref:RNA polymerase I associated factor, A49-like protein n=1 Tax=Thelephora ganbajun TaxID=370292 RepID=A0ACB6ZJG5_THEGA|nr:RNA polymerase I associated factor, A49-like protein [Thelephora ganbajun]